MNSTEKQFQQRKEAALDLIKVLEKKVKAFGASSKIDYGHIGSMGHVIEELQRLDEFMGPYTIEEPQVVVAELNKFFESMEMNLSRYDVMNGSGECEATAYGFYEVGLRNVAKTFKQFRKTSEHFRDSELLVEDNMKFRIVHG